MLTRVISGAVLAIIALVTILAGGSILLGILLFLSLTAFMELSKATGVHTEKKKFNGLEIVGVLGIITYYVIIYTSQLETFVCLALIMILIAFMFVYVFSFPKFHANQVMKGYFGVIYAPVMLSFIYLTRNLPYGVYIVWMIFISSWICDTCAYFFGVTFGKHKLAPVLSPKKSIEGAIGGVFGSAIVGALYAYFVVEKVVENQQIIWIFALISALGAIIAQVGDLAASGIKRNHEIKDYGKLIPGHGGVMDRFDSVIFTAPIIYFLAVLFIKG